MFSVALLALHVLARVRIGPEPHRQFSNRETKRKGLLKGERVMLPGRSIEMPMERQCSGYMQAAYPKVASHCAVGPSQNVVSVGPCRGPSERIVKD